MKIPAYLNFTFTALLMLVVNAHLWAQQPAQFSLYMQNKFGFNPAYAGLENTLIANATYRSQWTGLPGNPVTQNINVHMPLYIVGGGIGISLENEAIGSWKHSAGMLTFNHQRTLSNGILSAGLSLGITQKQIDGKKIKTPGTIFDDLGNPVDHNDVLLSTGVETGLGPVMNGGLYYLSEKMEIGFSVMNLLENKIDMGLLAFKPKRSFHVFTSYHFDISRSLNVRPSVLIKSDVAQTQMEFSVLTSYNENIFAGASFRGYHSESLDAIAILTGFRLSEKISLFYAYDLTLSNLNSVSSGSHELLLNYNLGKPIGKGIPPKIIYNPRSL